MSGYFFYGILCHEPLLRAVLGRTPTVIAAHLPGHAVFWAEGSFLPVLVPADGQAEGIFVPDLSGEDVARLDYFEAGFGHRTRLSEVETDDGTRRPARVYLPEPPDHRPGAPWRLEDWVERWGDTMVATAEDMMNGYGDLSPETVRQRQAQLLVRGASRVRAGVRRDTESLRRSARPEDVTRHRLGLPYAGYFAVEEHELSFRRFDGTMSDRLNRAVFISGDAAVVLPYDPARDRVLLIEQFRAGPYARGDANPWLIETVAGRIDGGETPENAARREALEEAGLTLADLLPGPRYYPSPAAKGEYIYSFIGLADLPDSIAGTIGGVEAEAEDIRSHLVPFERLMEMVGTGEIDNAPLIVLAFWLDRMRADLRPRLTAP